MNLVVCGQDIVIVANIARGFHSGSRFTWNLWYGIVAISPLGVRTLVQAELTTGRRSLDTNLQTVGNVAVIELLGDSLDISNSEDVKNSLSSLAANHSYVVVDLGQLSFLDSSGCGALVEGQRRFREAGGEMRLCCPSKNVRTVLEIARLTRILGVHSTRDEAIAAFSTRK